MFKPKKCPEDCAFQQKINGNERCCGYLEIRGQMRGCEPGPECKKYIPNRSGRRKGPKWDTEKGRAMWVLGHRDREIAEALGAKVESVRNYRRFHWQKGE